MTILALAAVTGAVASGTPAIAGDRPTPKAERVPAVHGVAAVKSHFTKPAQPASHVPTKTTWPSSSSATLTLAAPKADTADGTRATSASTPVWAHTLAPGKGRSYAGPGKLQVKVLDHAAAEVAGVPGVLMTVTGDRAGRATVGLDYSSFAEAYGGSYGTRLGLVSYPACVLTTPAKPACRTATPLSSTNDAASSTVQAAVSVPASAALVLAAQSAGADGEGGSTSGTFEATTLAPSGSWGAGSSTGSFTYSYPMTAPETTGLVPRVTLSYDSSSVDGKTASTQAQASWLGEGWSTPESFIEQSFQVCSESPEGSASPVATADQCYDGPILTMSLEGASSSLVWDKTQKVFKSGNADGSIITHFCALPANASTFTDPTCTKGASNGSGSYYNDWWQVAKRDGTVYSFGRNHLPGWASTTDNTNSASNEPVYSAHSGDPCYSSSEFSSSSCTMTYRWGLDYAVGTHSSAMAYYYHQDTNNYGKNNGATVATYARDQYLTHIDYGFTDGNAYGTVADRIVFGTSDRCVTSGCGPLSASTKANFMDVPYDMVCTSSTTCPTRAPSYFSTVRLTSLTIKQYSPDAKDYLPIDSYVFTQTIPTKTGDATNPTLWLSSIVHTGSDKGGGSTATKALPAVTFTPTSLPNRVNTATDGLLPFYKMRMGTITTESGSVIGVDYYQPNPCTDTHAIDPASNTTSCYPVSWTPNGYTEPIKDWFNKYVVHSVTQTDPTGGAPAVTTSYEYKGGAAWHYDDDELVKAKYRTYGQYRGYGDVVTHVGDGFNDRQTTSETTYYRGMSRDNNSTVVNVTDSQGGVHEDLEQLAGETSESASSLGSNVDHSSITSYWVSAPAATRSRDGLPDLTARLVSPIEVYTRQAVTSGASTTWRYTETDTSYDATPSDTNFGLQTEQYTHTVPVDHAYDKCTTSSYAPANTAKNIVGLTSQEEIDAVACTGYVAGGKPSVPGSVNTLVAPVAVSRPAQIVSATRTFYDDTTFDASFPQAAAPTQGDVTMVQKAVNYSLSAFVWQTSARTKYDTRGRATDVYDANNSHTSTGYTDNSVGVTTAMTVTNALGQITKTTLDPARGSVLTSTDANSIVTTAQYDALGRSTSVWLHSRGTTSPLPAADRLYTYNLASSGPSSVTTQTLNNENTYVTTIALYDGFLRPRQTQAPTPEGGRLVNDMFYDSRGWVEAKYTGWWDPDDPPNTSIDEPTAPHDETIAVPMQDFYTYDGLGRQIIDVNENSGREVSRTTTVYNGDRTTVVPPSGGTIKTTVLDPVGRTSEIDSYLTPPSVTAPSDLFTGTYRVTGGTTNAISYGYDARGDQDGITQAGATWTSTYNLLGQLTSRSDPDAGNSTNMRYDGVGNLLQSTDALGHTTSITYDALSRKTGTYNSTVENQQSGATGNQVGAWVYDNADGLAGFTDPVGQVTKATTYIGGQAYVSQQLGFNAFGESVGTSVTIPAGSPGEGNLGGTYTVRHVYSPTLGLPVKDTYTSQGGLPAETVLHNYRPTFDLPNNISSSLGAYAQTTDYDAYSRVSKQEVGPAGNVTDLYPQYDPNTGRVTDQLVAHTTGTGSSTVTKFLDEQAYNYDPAGNILSQTSTRSGDSSKSETQCFGYDGLDQLVTAWTANDKCATGPGSGNSSMVADNLGANSAYWTTWSFDGLGDRTSQVQHGFAGGPAADATTTYGYGTSGGAQPHTLTSAGANSYSYDAAGEMTSRKAGQGNQTLSYDNGGKLVAVKGSTGGDTDFEYAADGTLLIQKDPSTTTLYLGDEQFAMNNSTGVVTGTRYYSLPGGGTVVRTGTTSTSFSYAFTDNHGTPTLYLDSTAANPTWRQYTPYGDPRGPSVTTPDNRGFLNKPLDATTGLTVVGARQYDPTVGRFVTIDPVLEPNDPTQINGYGYAGNNPVVHADPTGLRIDPMGKASDVAFSSDRDLYANANSNGSGNGDHDPDADNGSGGGCNSYCQWLKKPTPYQPSLDDRCGNRGVAPASVCHRGTFTYADALELGSSNSDNWYWSCSTVMKLNSTSCAHHNPFANPHGLAAGLSIVALFATAYTGGIAGIASLPEAALFYATQDATVLTAGGGAAASEGAADYVASKILAGLEYDGTATTSTELEAALKEFCESESFAPDTPVLLADKKIKPIKDVKVGDKVASADPVTATSLGEVVTQLHDNLDTDLADLTISAGSHSQTIHTTQKHLFWDVSTLKWTPVAALRRGDQLATVPGLIARVQDVRPSAGSRHMLNLTVANLHTYYVLASKIPVLVHNAAACVIGNYPAYREAAEADGHHFFEVPMEHWTRLGPDEQVAANMKFLKRGADRGDTFHLATPPTARSVAGTYYEEEIKYLVSRGYTYNDDLTALMPPGR